MLLMNAFPRWQELRLILRRWPWIDLLCAVGLFLFGFLAVIAPSEVLNVSHFDSLRRSLWLTGPACLIVAGAQLVLPLFFGPKTRSVCAFASLWGYLGIFLAVSSYTGKIAWGMLMLQEALIWLAIIL